MTPPSGPQQAGTTATTAPAHDRVFNSDLLMSASDVEHAKPQFPEIIHVTELSAFEGKTQRLSCAALSCDRFHRSASADEHIHLMTELELGAVDELVGFLRTHYKVRFVFQQIFLAVTDVGYR